MMYINYSLEASSEHLRVLAGSALRMTGSDARSQLGHARTKKKKLFSQQALLPGLQPKCISSTYSRVCTMTREHGSRSRCAFMVKELQRHTTCQDCPGDGDVSRVMCMCTAADVSQNLWNRYLSMN